MADTSGLQAAVTDWLARLGDEIASQVVDAVRAQAPRAFTGDLEAGISGTATPTGTGVNIEINSAAFYSSWVDLGRGPIDKSPGFLVFNPFGEPGVTVFTHHVGPSTPREFFEPYIPTIVDGIVIDALSTVRL